LIVCEVAIPVCNCAQTVQNLYLENSAVGEVMLKVTEWCCPVSC